MVLGILVGAPAWTLSILIPMSDVYLERDFEVCQFKTASARSTAGGDLSVRYQFGPPAPRTRSGLAADAVRDQVGSAAYRGCVGAAGSAG